MKTLLLILALISFSYSETLDSLLHDYKQESELSKKTKNESAGNIIVYTRDDLERMQVESLKDILKSLRLFAYSENKMKMPDILNEDPMNYYSSSVRVYLNETELVSGITGSGFILFGDIEMDFIDHVEIYQGFPSFDFGIEPATTVIRLYSKSAEHDEGGRVKATLSTDGSNKENAYYTNRENGISYLLYANRTDEVDDKYKYKNKTLKQDTETNRFYGSLGIKDHTFDFHFMNISGDAFLGPLLGNVPNNTSREHQFINLSTNSSFLDDSLFLNLSYTNIENEQLANYDSGQVAFLGGLPSPLSSYKHIMDEEVFTASLKKTWNLSSHALTLGAQYRYKSFDMSGLYIDEVLSNTPQVYDKEDIYSVFLQDLITIDENHIISLSVMNQEFVRNNNIKDHNTLQLRFGYIYTDREWVAKTFISSQEFATEPYLLMRNNELEESIYKSILQEFAYNTPQTLSKVTLGYGMSEKMIIPNILNLSSVKNSDIDVTLLTAIAEFTYYFNIKDKLELQANYWYIESPLTTENDPTERISYVARLINTYSNFDIFNELLIHTGYTHLDNAYEYSLGVKYNVNKDLHINFKGENIFDNSLDTDFLVLQDSTLSPDKIFTPSIERRFTFGIDYLF